MATNAENIRNPDARAITAARRLIAREGVLALTVKALADEADVAMSSMRYSDCCTVRGYLNQTYLPC